ncbi:MAG: substrate-binding domain-containing protein [Candidatus Omnitrophica bacterium]|nr:substrate-binding domain-containing protein [Candidatus Omnitrophota bacterium]MCB9783152.1 substrate-binding domain-containing protein [Candidatus Omnitrophota bacterium]
MKKLFGSLFLVPFLLFGCGKPAPEGSDDLSVEISAPESPQYLVVFSQCNNAEPYRAAQNKLMEKLWGDYDNVELEIMDAQQDNSKQISQIETAIRKKPDLLIVAPNERGPLTEIMGKAMQANIPTICLERDIVEPNYTTFIKCDNFAIAQKAGEYVEKYLTEKNGEPKGKIVELRGLLGVDAEVQRYEGFHEVLDKHEGVEFVQEAVADWLQSKGRERMTEILRAQPEIDVVYGHNDPMAVGAYLAAKDLGREKEMIFVGVDGLGGNAGGIKKVMDGVLALTFIYPLCVDKAVEVGHQILTDPDFAPEETYVMESTMITPENAAEMYEKYTLE